MLVKIGILTETGVLNRAKATKQRTGNTKQSSRWSRKTLHTLSERDLIRLESRVGSELFGPIPKGGRREFFNLDPQTWIWYEESIDPITKKKVSRTVKYEVYEDYILKALEGPAFIKIRGEELRNFTLTTHVYYERTMREIYNRDPNTGKKLSQPL